MFLKLKSGSKQEWWFLTTVLLLLLWLWPLRVYSKYVQNYPDSILVIEHKINDSLIAPSFLYNPKRYNFLPTPLIIYLHGGVSRPEFPEITPPDLREDPLFQLCMDSSWFYLFPLARHDCHWWNETGMRHLEWLLDTLFNAFNIDPDRVSIGGFSDGGSGSFHLAMLHPTPFAQFFPWSGHLSVGSLAGNFDQYLPNLRNRPLYPTTGGRDGLYPTERMLPLLNLAIEAGAKLEHVAYDTATHNDAYLTLEIPRIAKMISQNRRNVYQKNLYWECSDTRWGRIDWLEITELDTLAPKADWHKDYNGKLKDTRVSIGFIPVQDTASNGVMVSSVVDDSNSAAVSMGLKAGDRIVQLDSFEITTYASFLKARSTKQRGDSILLGVIRERQRLTLRGKIPPIQEYDAFPRRYLSGAVIAQIEGNRIVLKTSRVKALNLYLNGNLVDKTQPITIDWNGRIVYKGFLPPEKDTRLLHPDSKRDPAYPYMSILPIKAP